MSKQKKKYKYNSCKECKPFRVIPKRGSSFKEKEKLPPREEIS